MRIGKKTFIVFLSVFFLGNHDAIGQDSLTCNPLKKKEFYRSLFAPTALISAGLLIKGSDDGLNTIIRDVRNEALPDFHTNVDDYLQYVPIVTVYGLDLAGVKSKNDFGNRTALLIKSEILMEVIVYPFKEYSRELRPDSSTYNSFPSGHTAQAFVAATFLHKEFGKKSIWYSIGAYTCASAVGVMRILNNRHWLSDVLVGAGIGIVATNVVYYTHLYKWSKKKGRTVLIPTYGNGAGLYFCHRFK